MLLLVSGSPSPLSANSRLLMEVGKLYRGDYLLTDYLPQLPVFQPELDQAPWPEEVLRWRRDAAAAKAIVFCSPAYLHNLPAVLKNALEWVTASGELNNKPALVFTYTPAPPRGDRARQSLLWSLDALNVRVVAEGPFYQNEVMLNEKGITDPDARAIILEALKLLPAI